MAQQYRQLGNHIAAFGERMFVQHHSRHGLQYLIASSAARGWVVINYGTTELYGVFGHPKPGGYEKALAARLEGQATEIKQKSRKSTWRNILRDILKRSG